MIDKTTSPLQKAPYCFTFFQAVRLLARQEGKNLTSSSFESPLRFKTPASLAFPPSEILSLQEKERASRNFGEAKPILEMEVAFFGLTGPSGVLPTCYTEFIMERRSYKDKSAHDFFDIFSHRFLCLFFEAWKKSRFHIATELQEKRQLRNYLLAFTGLSDLEADNDLFAPGFFSYFAGSLSRKPVPAACLSAMASAYFETPARLEQFVGQWLPVSPSEQSRLGHQACALGQDAFLGERIWDCQTKVKLHLGPMNRETFKKLMPGESGEKALKHLANVALGLTLACDVQLSLLPEEAPQPILGQSRLGLDGWLCTTPAREMLTDVSYALQA